MVLHTGCSTTCCFRTSLNVRHADLARVWNSSSSSSWAEPRRSFVDVRFLTKWWCASCVHNQKITRIICNFISKLLTVLKIPFQTNIVNISSLSLKSSLISPFWPLDCAICVHTWPPRENYDTHKFYQSILGIFPYYDHPPSTTFCGPWKLCLNSPVLLKISNYLIYTWILWRGTFLGTSCALCPRIPRSTCRSSTQLSGDLLRCLATLPVFLVPLSEACTGR